MVNVESYFNSVSIYTDLLQNIIDRDVFGTSFSCDKLITETSLIIDPSMQHKLRDAMTAGKVTNVICKQVDGYTAVLELLGTDISFNIIKGGLTIFTAMMYTFRKRNLIQVRVKGLAEDAIGNRGYLSESVGTLLELGRCLGFYEYRNKTIGYATYQDGWPVYLCVQLERVLLDV